MYTTDFACSAGVRALRRRWSFPGFSGGVILIALVNACSSDSGAPQPDQKEPAKVSSVAEAVTGNMHPDAIQIDGPADGADMWKNLGTPLNAGAAKDWVADDGEHWNGLRILDGIASADLDIFLTGGKEDDFASWNIGAGTVGSSKYDIVQAYLANNQSTLFFGMERRGNNGTTAFDFEFNQLAPMALSSCPQNPLIPCRSVGDVLFVFEMQGSGNTGSATPHKLTWDGSSFSGDVAEGIVSSINNVPTPSGPWGHADSHGNWVVGDLDRFTFAEAAAPISLLPAINACGGQAYVQVRTRSSATPSSDLKDTTKVYHFEFMNVTAKAALAPSCDQGFNFSATGKDADGKDIQNPTCKWTFTGGAQPIVSTDCSGFMPAASGTYTGTLELSDPNVPGCSVTVKTEPVNVYPPLGVTGSLEATCENSFKYSATPSGGSGGVNYLWSFSGGGTTDPVSSTLQSGSVAVGSAGVSYTGSVTVTDSRTDKVCTATAEASATPLGPLAIDLGASAGSLSCPMSDDAITLTALPSGGNGDYSFVWQGDTEADACPDDTTTCTINGSGFCDTRAVTVTLKDSSGLCSSVTSLPAVYEKKTTVTLTK